MFQKGMFLVMFAAQKAEYIKLYRLSISGNGEHCLILVVKVLIRTVGVEVSGHSNLNTEESWAVWARDGSSSRRLGFVFSGLPVLLCCIRHVGFTSLVAVMDPLFSKVSTSQEPGLIVKVGLLAILKKNIFALRRNVFFL